MIGDARHCVASCGERFILKDNGYKCADTCQDELFKQELVYGVQQNVCTPSGQCMFYVKENENSEVLTEKYGRCVRNCPSELPVYKDG